MGLFPRVSIFLVMLSLITVFGLSWFMPMIVEMEWLPVRAKEWLYDILWHAKIRWGAVGTMKLMWFLVCVIGIAEGLSWRRKHIAGGYNPLLFVSAGIWLSGLIISVLGLIWTSYDPPQYLVLMTISGFAFLFSFTLVGGFPSLR